MPLSLAYIKSLQERLKKFQNLLTGLEWLSYAVGYGKFIAMLKIDEGQFSNPGEFYLPHSCIQRCCLHKAKISTTKRALRKMDKRWQLKKKPRKPASSQQQRWGLVPVQRSEKELSLRRWFSILNFLIASKRQNLKPFPWESHIFQLFSLYTFRHRTSSQSKFTFTLAEHTYQSS